MPYHSRNTLAAWIMVTDRSQSVTPWRQGATGGALWRNRSPGGRRCRDVKPPNVLLTAYGEPQL